MFNGTRLRAETNAVKIRSVCGAVSPMSGKDRREGRRAKVWRNACPIEGLESRRMLSAYTLVVLGAFDGTNGSTPGDLAIDSSGNLFGAAANGSDLALNNGFGGGTVFEIANGTNSIDTLASFNGVNGTNPYAGVTLDPDGNLFGTTFEGGDLASALGYGLGSTFEIAHGATVITTVANFERTNGANPEGGLTLDSNGNLFGTASFGGASEDGTVFEIAQGSNVITTLASFNGTDGATPASTMILDSNGNLFGTTSGGGNGYGTVFEIAHGTSTITTVASFNDVNGNFAYGEGGVGSLALDSNGDLFGTTPYGGDLSLTNPYSNVAGAGDGTVFEIARGTRTITTLADFSGLDGATPFGGVTLDSNGDVFGTTYDGGSDNLGTVYEIPHGTRSIATLVNFNGANGANPGAGLIFDSYGDLFGTTGSGGFSDDGEVFELSAVTVTVNPTSQVVASGDTVTLSAAASADPPPLVQWQISTDDGRTFTNIAGATAASYSFTATTAQNGDQYRAVFTNSQGSATTTTATLTVTPASPLTPVFGNMSLPPSIAAGARIKAKVTVVVTNQGNELNGEVTVNIYANTSMSLDGNHVLVATSTKNLSLKEGKGRAFAFNIQSVPATLADGSYYLLAEVTDPTGSNNVTAAPHTFQVAAAFVKPVIMVGAVNPSSIAVGKSASVPLTITNQGNETASGIRITLNPSEDGSTPMAEIILDSLQSGLKLPPGKSKVFKLHFKITSALPAGSYFPYVSVQLGGQPATAVGASAFAVSE